MMVEGISQEQKLTRSSTSPGQVADRFRAQERRLERWLPDGVGKLLYDRGSSRQQVAARVAANHGSGACQNLPFNGRAAMPNQYRKCGVEFPTCIDGAIFENRDLTEHLVRRRDALAIPRALRGFERHARTCLRLTNAALG